DDALHLALGARVFQSATVVASPAAATETIIASVTLANDLAIGSGVLLLGYAAFTAGTSGTGATLKLRQTDTSGTTVKTSGILPVTAAALYAPGILGFDASPLSNAGVYVMTLTVANGAAASTVSAVTLIAVAI